MGVDIFIMMNCLLLIFIGSWKSSYIMLQMQFEVTFKLYDTYFQTLQAQRLEPRQ